MVQQIEITLQPKRRGFHLVNCDPDVRVDMETIFNRLVPEMTNEREDLLGN